MKVSAQIAALTALLDGQAGRYKRLNGAGSFRAYLETARTREDEEMLTEPILADVLESLLGFPKDAYFSQLGHSGSKPDFTPIDLVAHRFVLDAKSSTQDLSAHEAQIRRYIDQRQLDLGVLFNLREIRVYRRGAVGHDPQLSFQLLPLWQVGHGEAMASVEATRLDAFCGLFSHRSMGLAEKVELVADAEPWHVKLGRGERIDIDLEFLVSRLRLLSRTLADDAAAQHERLLDDIDLNPQHEHRLRMELEVLAREIEPRADPADLPRSAKRYPAAGGLAGRAWRQYLMRVSQLTLIRILLYRSWEDAGFVDDRLYDGGFGLAYERLERSLRRVLDEAYLKGRDRYPWLFGSDNNYDWYRPRDEALAEVLYALVPVPLGRLGADVLGGLYESYVDDIDRDRLGQFYTPRSVVSFMLDRVGYTGAEGVFRVEGDERIPRSVFDFSTGSGGFLVEAARRVVDDAGLRHDDPTDLRDGLGAIVKGFHGCEISPFPYFLTEVNLLLQVSRLLGRMRAVGKEPPNFTLGVVHTDALGARAGTGSSLDGLSPALRADAAVLAADERYGLVPLDHEKQARFAEIRRDGSFDVVVGNPPYVAETGNKVLFDRLRALPGWKGDYRGKSDYYYYFLLMAAEKLAPGGRLGVITPASWMGAGQADWLRERLAGQLRLDELFLFGSMRLFATEAEERDTRAGATPPTVESAILIATRQQAPPDHKLRVVVLEDEMAAAAALTGDEQSTVPRHALLEAMRRRAGGPTGREDGLLVHDIAQVALRSTRPWPIKHTSRDIASRVVAHIEKRLGASRAPVEPLERRWQTVRGIETGADAFTKRIQKGLPDEVQARLTAEGHQTGDRILELVPATAARPPWCELPHLLARSPEPRALLFGAIDDEDHNQLVWIGRGETAPSAVQEALEPWRDVLRLRAEFKRNPARRWFETAWTRDKDSLRGPKVIALHRTDRGRFALDEHGVWQPSNKSTVTTPREPTLSTAYLCGLLNSELLDLWYAVRGRTPWHDRRDYEPKPMNAMPYRHVALPNGWTPGSLVAALESALGSDDDATILPAAVAIAAAVGSPATDADALRAVEQLVRAVAANRRTLLPLRTVAPELRRAVKSPWRTHGVEVDPAAVAAELPVAHTRSVRLDPSLTVTVHSDGPVGRSTAADGRLTFRHARRITATIDGPTERLAVVAAAAPPSLAAADLTSVVLPKDLTILELALADATQRVDAGLRRGRTLVEAVERLVCALYGVDSKLTELVVASAVARAGTVAAEDEEVTARG